MKRAISRAAYRVHDYVVTRKKSFLALKYLVIGLPPAILGYSMLRFPVRLLGQDVLVSFFQDHLWAVPTAFLWTLVTTFSLEVVSDVIKRLSDNEPKMKVEVASLFSSINEILAQKVNRFGTYAAKMNGSADARAVFAEITQPEKQIEALIRQLHTTLVTVTQDDGLKVVLACMEGNCPVSWQAYMPSDARPSNELLSPGIAARTTFARCAYKRHSVLIKDIATELKRKAGKGKRRNFVAIGERPEEKGSLIAFPVVNDHLALVPYVLSIKSDKETINDTFEYRYNFIIAAFIKRLVLEQTLQHIKARTTFQ